MSKRNKLLLLIVCLNLVGTIVLYAKHRIVKRDLDAVRSMIIFDEEEV